MKLYRLYTTCPYYGDITENGIFSSLEKVAEAKEIICRNIGIEDYAERFSIDKVELDKMPYDLRKDEKENRKVVAKNHYRRYKKHIISDSH